MKQHTARMKAVWPQNGVVIAPPGFRHAASELQCSLVRQLPAGFLSV